MSPMSTVKIIRTHLHLTQSALAEKLGCSQGNVWQYERQDKPQTIPPEMAKRLIDVAKAEAGMDLTLDQIYGRVPLPPLPAEPESATTS